MNKGNAMNDGEMDRILFRRDEITPSSGFVTSVMEAVHLEAAAPPPIPFPWKRALPMVGLCVVALILTSLFAVTVIVAAAHSDGSAGSKWADNAMLGFWQQSGLGSALTWAAVSLLAGLISLKLSMRLAGDRP